MKPNVEIFAVAFGQRNVDSRSSPPITILLDWRQNPPPAGQPAPGA